MSSLSTKETYHLSVLGVMVGVGRLIRAPPASSFLIALSQY